ncbi:acyltransferase [Leifsonia aquatica]|uniref:Acyltransferase n=2 Tax=Leifsonia aquatica TaxID=144185 RepID=U2T4X6_LEIAQ|nr:acyltransferase [Leifsonia aquatica]ERK72518.1 acyltransferase [Leifsonia aquatica ATCC 14665]MBB2966972.1 surface polysaccharide O-acyltransferase-like enzyme [Leifsonia aquatica]
MNQPPHELDAIATGDDVAAPRTRSVGLDVLRTTAILGVVAIHVFGNIVGNPAIRGSGTWWAATVIDVANVWVVPVFVMVSGALVLSPRAHVDGPAAFYRKRLLRLGPAFVFWQVFYFVVVRMLMSHQHFTLVETAGLVFDAKTYTHLYFLWLIVGLYAVAPVLAAFLHGGGPRRAVIFASCTLGLTVVVVGLSGLATMHGDPHPIVLNALTQWVPYVGYFLAGWALRNVTLRAGWTIAAALATVALLAMTIWQYNGVAVPGWLNAVSPPGYYSAIVAAASVGVFVVVNSLCAHVRTRPVQRRGMLTTLSDAAFGVYLVHFFILVLAELVVPGLLPRLQTTLWVAIAVWAGVCVLSFAISIGARRVPVLRRLF